MTLTREHHLLADLQLSTSLGLELGPLDKPLVKKTDGKIIYADHLSAQQLRQSYRLDPSVNIDNIEVDVVLDKKKISDVFCKDFLADYIIASHVIEHVPDLVGWLEDLRRALRPTGQLRLAIPDRRFTFDFKREVSCLADVMGAYASCATKPQPRQVFDYFYNVADIDQLAAWRGEIQRDQLSFPQRHKALTAARQTYHEQRWIEVHCWVFTPFSFATLMLDLCEMGLLTFRCAKFIDTQPNALEFFLALTPSDDPQQVASSWMAMASAAHHHDPEARAAGSVARQHVLMAALQRQALRRHRVLTAESTGCIR